MMRGGWFPFIEIIGGEYKTLIECYQNKFDFDNRVHKVVERFDQERIEKISGKWWGKEIFAEKKSILEAGVTAYLNGGESGYITSIKTLLSEIEGIIRLLYFRDRGERPTFSALIQFIVDKGKGRSGSDFSLILPVPFLQYLKDVVFANLDPESGEVVLSHHSAGHGVADSITYTRERALQAILTLDQIFFYL